MHERPTHNPSLIDNYPQFTHYQPLSHTANGSRQPPPPPHSAYAGWPSNSGQKLGHSALSRCSCTQNLGILHSISVNTCTSSSFSVLLWYNSSTNCDNHPQNNCFDSAQNRRFLPRHDPHRWNKSLLELISWWQQA